MYEHRRQPLLSRRAFAHRVGRHLTLATGLVALALGLGILGYRLTEGMGWLDAFLNASMILGGMGPVGELHTPAGKLFAGCYALFSGLAFITVTGILLGPFVHRLIHRLHLEEGREGD